MRISDWSSDVCSSDLVGKVFGLRLHPVDEAAQRFGAIAEGLRRPAGPSRARGRDLGIDVAHPAAPQFGAGRGLVGNQIFAHRRGPPWSKERSEEHTSELQSLMRNSYAVFCWKTKIIP